MGNVHGTENLVQRPVLCSVCRDGHGIKTGPRRAPKCRTAAVEVAAGCGVTSSPMRAHWPHRGVVTSSRLGRVALGGVREKCSVASLLCPHTGTCVGRQPNPARGLLEDKQGM